MFFSKLRRLFRHQKKSKKSNEPLIENEPPHAAEHDETDSDSIKGTTPPQYTKLPRQFIQSKYGLLRKVADGNEVAVTTTTTTKPPKFRKSAKLQSSKRNQNKKYGPLKNVDDENASTVTTTTSTTAATQPPKFRKSSKWQSSKHFAQNAYRYRFRHHPPSNPRFITSRSKNGPTYLLFNSSHSKIAAYYNRMALQSQS